MPEIKSIVKFKDGKLRYSPDDVDTWARALDGRIPAKIACGFVEFIPTRPAGERLVDVRYVVGYDDISHIREALPEDLEHMSMP